MRATMTVRAEIMGRDVFDVFPDNPDDPDATGVTNLRASLHRVRQHSVADTMAIQKYEVGNPAEPGGFESRYWSICNSPVLGADRQLIYILVSTVITDALNLSRPLADAGGVRLSARPRLPADLCVAADYKRLRQVLLNLLSNAIKYNHPTGTVTVTVEHRSDQRLRISVTDTGRGMAEDALSKLFTPFERLDAAQAGFAGTGLGLALSHHLVETMHGTLGVASNPGRGSTFWIDLATAEPATGPTSPAKASSAGCMRIPPPMTFPS
jgi:anti-sigma regulatory factor (Ser/Thr protein kinase)